jgi:YebC/PmpR family DNA-binding regulatory protein
VAGHSKWAQIKRQKAVNDNKRGAIFARLSREIIVATKLGGPDPAGNFRLRTAIEKAKAALLPAENIQRAIDKGAGKTGADNLENLQYEGYGPGGVAILIEAVTDNRNRTAGDIRSYFNKFQGNLGSDGCVAWIFVERGVIEVPQQAEDAVLEAALDAGAEDVQPNPETGHLEVYTPPDALNAVCQALNDAGIAVLSAEVNRTPQNTVAVTDATIAKPLLRLLDTLEAHDDVQAVHANMELDDALLEQFA